MFSGLLTKYHGLKPLLVGVPYPVVYEIPSKRNQSPPPHKYPDHGFGHISDPYLDPPRYSDQVVNNRIPENQPPPQPKYPNYDLLPDQPDSDYDARNTRREDEVYALSEAEKKMVDNFRQQRGQSDQGFYSDSTPERNRLYSRDQGGQGGQGGQREQGGQDGQGRQAGPRQHSRETVDISEYEDSPDHGFGRNSDPYPGPRIDFELGG